MSMNILEEAVIYATIMHQGKKRKGNGSPYILHPLEVSQIISTMTDDVEIITAGVLHDIVEDTDGSLEEISLRFGDRVAALVETETENKYLGEDSSETWKRRKEESLTVLKNCNDDGTRILWLADKLSNIRALAQLFGERGDAMWNVFNMQDPMQHRWYYCSIAKELELHLNKTGAYKELIKHINYIWPGSFVSEKTKYKKYKDVSVDGCEIIGRGSKSIVYKYNDELVIKVYNEKNTFMDIEKEVSLSRQAFIAGIPTAISFGIVSVGKCYGSMFELLKPQSISQKIALSSGSVSYYAELMANLAKTIHSTDALGITDDDHMEEVRAWVDGGVAIADEKLAARVNAFIESIPKVNTLIHGDLHTGNVLMLDSEPVLIDLDSLSVCHPIVELSGVYMSYIGFNEIDSNMIESFMGFSKDTAELFFKEFMKAYFDTEDEAVLQKETDRAALLCYIRLVRRIYKAGRNLSPEKLEIRDRLINKINALLDSAELYQ